MKILLDSCVSGNLQAPLEEAGYDVQWTGDWPVDPGDDQILAYAYRERRILVTLDKDFGALAIRDGQPHAGIVCLVNLSLRDQAAVCQQIFQKYGADLSRGAIITADQNKLRIRQPD